jgi:hypothetical protein
MKCLSFLLGAIGVSACGTLNRESASAPEITYEKKTFMLESAKECQEDQACARYEVTYPAFAGISQSVRDSIHREIELLVSMGDPAAENKSMPQIAQEFLDSYKKFIIEMPGGEMGWHYNADVVVNVLTDTLLSLEISDEYFTGGAHGGSGTHFINIHPGTGKKATLSSLLKPGFENSLTSAGESAFRNERELTDTATYRFNGFEFPEDRFQLGNNYGFTNEGIVFVFNSYEIAPYAAGPTEFLIPYAQIKDWLK